jgi:hypothetical protein
MHKLIAAASLAAVLCIPPALAQQPSSVSVRNYDVFVDPPTGFVFVKLPQGWKFAGKVDAAQMDRLPATVLTWLLPAEADDAVRMAQLKLDAQPR